MATHLAAWQQSVDNTAGLAALTAVNDDILTLSGTTRFLVQAGLDNIHWAVASGAADKRAQIVTPSLLVKRQNPEVLPRVAASEKLTLSGPELFRPYRPIKLMVSETIEFQSANVGAGAQQQDGFVCLGPDALPAIPAGDIRIVRATGTTTLVARAWTTVPLTLDSSLEPGTYTLIGFIPISANCVMARALITGQNNRPGMPGLAGTEAAASDFDAGLYNQLMYYNMGSFTHINVPNVQYWASAADTTETVFMYIIRTGGI